MNTDTKIIAITVFLTFAVIIAGIFISSRSAGNTSGKKIDEKILVRENSSKIATDSAKATLVEFADFQCPACQNTYPAVKKIIQEYKGQLNYVFRHFPLDQHKYARLLSYSSEAAGKQGKFWEMYDKQFEKKLDWDTEKNSKETIEGYAKELNLNIEQFKKDLENEEIKKKVDGDYDDGVKAGVDATPTFYLNGIKIDPKGYEELKKEIDNSLK